MRHIFDPQCGAMGSILWLLLEMINHVKTGAKRTVSKQLSKHFLWSNLHSLQPLLGFQVKGNFTIFCDDRTNTKVTFFGYFFNYFKLYVWTSNFPVVGNWWSDNWAPRIKQITVLVLTLTIFLHWSTLKDKRLWSSHWILVYRSGSWIHSHNIFIFNFVLIYITGLGGGGNDGAWVDVYICLIPCTKW